MWGPIFPAAVATLLVGWWFRSRRAALLQGAVAAPLLGMFAPVRRLIAESQSAGFAEMLALLIESRMPMNEALPLAAEATGDRAIIQSARRIAAELSAGGSASAISGGRDVGGAKLGRTSIPPMLQWLIATGATQPNFATALRQSADTYRRRAIARADWLRWRLPVILTVAVGGAATLIYALLLFVPWIAMLKELSRG